ncbi:MAG TPA: EAL domain-containing protein, partial [Thermoanaerobaculia bacterium]|nr:EAL domain-containing protein [Thermoanaerobaculia bacterium]
LNVSARLFSDPSLAGRVQTALQEAHAGGERLVLEITESALMEEPETATEVLSRIRTQGVQVAIDDFGTGYSSLSYLQQFPIESLKIDRSFIARVGEQGENAEILRAILTLARSLGIRVIAEGVETGEQLAQLVAMGCDMAQGYLFSPPVDAGTARALLAQPPAWAGLLRPFCPRPALKIVGRGF